MTYILAGITLLSLAMDVFAVRKFLAYIELRDQREAEERARAAKERNGLLTRIQTPHLAPALAVEEDPNANQFVDDQIDEDFHEKTQD